MFKLAGTFISPIPSNPHPTPPPLVFYVFLFCLFAFSTGGVSSILFRPGVDPLEVKPESVVSNRIIIPNSNGMTVSSGGMDGGVCLYKTSSNSSSTQELGRPVSIHMSLHAGPITALSVYTGIVGI
jgi:hypothetical protein